MQQQQLALAGDASASGARANTLAGKRTALEALALFLLATQHKDGANYPADYKAIPAKDVCSTLNRPYGLCGGAAGHRGVPCYDRGCDGTTTVCTLTGSA